MRIQHSLNLLDVEYIESFLAAILRQGCALEDLEHFRAKWIPVRVKKMRQNKHLEPLSDSAETESALSQRRPNMHRILSRGVALAMVLTPLAPASAQTQMELNAKAANAFTKADKRLNDIYQKLMAKISPSGQASLRDVEKVWIQFRDQECAFETLATVDGSIHPMVLLRMQGAPHRPADQGSRGSIEL
jgi:uncharacterized protein YecT (DUF1311 family)